MTSNRNPDQVNTALDRTEQILSDLTVRLDRLEQTVEVFARSVTETVESSNRRLLSLEESREEHEGTIERLETLISSHDARMQQLEENGQDLKSILQLLTQRFTEGAQ